MYLFFLVVREFETSQKSLGGDSGPSEASLPSVSA